MITRLLSQPIGFLPRLLNPTAQKPSTAQKHAHTCAQFSNQWAKNIEFSIILLSVGELEIVFSIKTWKLNPLGSAPYWDGFCYKQFNVPIHKSTHKVHVYNLKRHIQRVCNKNLLPAQKD